MTRQAGKGKYEKAGRKRYNRKRQAGREGRHVCNQAGRQAGSAELLVPGPSQSPYGRMHICVCTWPELGATPPWTCVCLRTSSAGYQPGDKRHEPIMFFSLGLNLPPSARTTRVTRGCGSSLDRRSPYHLVGCRFDRRYQGTSEK